jgi:hypothetical protein
VKDDISEKDAVRLLRRLSVRGVRLIAGEGGHHRLVGHKRGRRQDRAEADPRTVAAALERGLIAPGAHGCLVPTAAGRALLRRSLAGADGYAAQHQERGKVVVNDPGLGSIRVTVNHDESPLSWLRRRKGIDGRPLIDAAEFAAGERLRSDYTRGRILPRVTANWTATVADRQRSAGGMAEITEAAIAARRRVEKALDTVGPEFSGPLIDFCCFLKGLEEIERERRWPARSAKLVLRLGLSSLARHYGLAATASGRHRSRAILHWGAEDYRPSVE